MKNIKRILNLILILFIVLSTLVITKAAAAPSVATPELDSIRNNNDSIADGVVTQEEYFNDFDMFCSQRGVALFSDPSAADNILGFKYEDGRGFYLELDEIHKDPNKHEVDITSLYESGIILTDKKTLRPVYELIEENKPASPEEAYILAEMLFNTNEYPGREVLNIRYTPLSLPWPEDWVHTFYGVDDPSEHYWGTASVEGVEKEIYEFNGRFYAKEGGDYREVTLRMISDTVGETTYKRSYVQRAWWNTDESRNTSGIDGGVFSEEAKEFEKYILNITGKSDADDLEKEEQSYSFLITNEDTGVAEPQEGTVIAPVLNYEPEWVGNLNEAKVEWDSEKGEYKVGPFKINYKAWTYKDDAGHQVMFSGISDSIVLSDLGYLSLDIDNNLDKGEYSFLHSYKNPSEGIDLEGKIDKAYPYPNEEFYIVFNPEKEKDEDGDGVGDGVFEHITEIQNIKFNFKYMNAGGTFDKYKGSVYEDIWQIDSTSKKIKVVSCREITDLQDMVVGGSANGGAVARWYEDVFIETNGIDLDGPQKSGQLKIIKEIVDENGELLPLTGDSVYQFVVETGMPNDAGEVKNTDGGFIHSEVENLSITIGSEESKGSRLTVEKIWQGDKAPEFKIIEVSANAVIEGYEFDHTEYVTAVSGEYKESMIDDPSTPENEADEGTIEIIVRNYYKKTGGDGDFKKGHLKIVKEISGIEELQEEATFKFEVKIDRDRNGSYDEAGETTEQVITIAKGQKSGYVEIKDITWLDDGGSAPTYEVSEIRSEEGYSFESISSNSSGNLLEDNTITVTVTNKPDPTIKKQAKLKIIKKLVDENGNLELADADKTFDFKLKIDINSDGNYTAPNEEFPVSITVPEGQATAESAEYIVEWPKYQGDPTYIVEEVPHSEYKLIGINNYSGTLVGGEEREVTVINSKTTRGNFGKLELCKKVKDKNGNSTPLDADTKFSFKVGVDLDNDGNIEEEERKDVYIIVPSNSSEFTIPLGVYFWTGSRAPKYEIEEFDIPTNYQLEGMQTTNGTVDSNKVAKGNLKNNNQTVTVTATNKNIYDEQHKGKIQIGKILRDEFGEVFVADRDYTFKFKVKVDGYPDDTIRINIEKGQYEGVGESNVEYKWEEESTPRYIVTEEDPQGFQSELINATGFLNGPIVEVLAINKNTTGNPHEGYIDIYKALVGEDGELVAADKTYEFDFKVRVRYADGSEKEELKTVRVNPGEYGGFVEAGPYRWKEGEQVPTYIVEEKTPVFVIEGENRIPTEDWKEVGIENDNNSLIPEGHVECLCINVQNDTIDPKINKGELQITKTLKDPDGNEVEGVEFEFKVTVNGILKGEGTEVLETEDYVETVKIKSGDSWAKEFIWKGDIAPSYTVTEVNIPDGYEFESMTHKYQKTNYDKETGTEVAEVTDGILKANHTIVVETINKYKGGGGTGGPGSEVYSGYLTINKDINIEDPKLNSGDLTDIEKTFNFKVTIYYDNPDQSFLYDGKAYNTLEINKEIVVNSGTSKLSDTIGITYPKGVGPKYIVEEVDVPRGWQLEATEGATGKFTNNGDNFVANFTNKLPINRKYILTMELGGTVWNDTDYSTGKPSDSGHDGLKHELEGGIGNVKVEIFKRSAAGDSLFMELYTDSNGKWKVPVIEVPVDYDPNTGDLIPNARYYVIYTYDGQTYEVTKELVKEDGTQGNAENFRTNNTSVESDDNANREKYLNGSMAKEDTLARDTFNNKFAEIWGDTPINNEGITFGKSTSENLEYYSRDAQYNGYSKKESKLKTLNDDGTIKYGMNASTVNSTFTLLYPFDDRTSLASVDEVILEDRGRGPLAYTYHAAYPYLNNINLGLLERPHADIAIEKELDEAIVVVNGKVYKYKYGEIANTQFAEYPDLLYKQVQINQRNINYTLNLYKSDYYYRASAYNTVIPEGETDNLGVLLENYLRTINPSLGLDSLNLDVYLTYKVSVRNESDIYDVKVNQISDYVDSSLELVTAPEYKYIDKEDGTIGDAVIVADAPTEWTWDVQAFNEPAGWGAPTPGYIDRTPGWRESSPVEYERYTTSSIGIHKILSGENVSSKMTFKVRKAADVVIDSVTGETTTITNCIQRGDKNNIVEIDNYSTYYADTRTNSDKRIVGKVAGRVDEDSAPGNININTKNSVNWYEDDTDISPTIKLGLYEEIRNLTGKVWEDSETHTIEYSQVVGDGVYDVDNEHLIPNMTTELVEKVTIGSDDNGDGVINGSDTLIDFDFIWPTDMEIAPGKTIAELTGFDSTTQTGNTGDELGKYKFTNIPAGNYVVRFTYGDGNTLDINDKDAKGNIKYSGQDYKSTTYQKDGIEIDLDNNSAIGDVDINADGNMDIKEVWNNYANIDMTPTSLTYGYVINEWHDLESEYSAVLAAANISDARDDEARRLDVIAKSQTMFYENTSIMSTNESTYDIDITNDDTDDTPRYYDKDLESYYMVANTAKLNLNIESVLNSRKGVVDEKGINSADESFFDKIVGDELKTIDPSIPGVEIHILNANRKISEEDSINIKVVEYNVKDIDFGIETRSENDVKLDKQIEQITLKTSAGDILIDAIYDIDYRIIHEDAVTGDRLIEPIIEPLISLNSASIGIENLQALNRTSGDLGFRYLNVDKDVLQGATITIKYRITALNVGEVDRCAKALQDLGEFVASVDEDGIATLDTDFTDVLDLIGILEADARNGYAYGTYLGKAYYQGADYNDPDTTDSDYEFYKNSIALDDEVVRTKVKQVIDYVDNDVVFSQMDNIAVDTSWANITTPELEENRLIDNTEEDPITGRRFIDSINPDDYSDDRILDSRGIAYEEATGSKNNLVVSVENNLGTSLANPILLTPLTPDEHTDGTDHNAYINLTVSRYYSSDMDIEEVENITETLKLYNDVGRRDLKTIQGNTKPALGAMALLPQMRDERNNLVPNLIYENDVSVTELITLSPPTGTVITAMLGLQVAAIALAAITILAGGIVIIKKKVLTK